MEVAFALDAWARGASSQFKVILRDLNRRLAIPSNLERYLNIVIF